ncbi:MAG: MerR family transcriptional regulator [Candidatus Dadabacteria bacterium]|nr:MerR family transcriptional regulator [Candidatus Dadabacteria bacterium]NIQ16824.1 MerR family transcriptional regulator [Candidatus Dadabacteria bacterium]
MKKKSKKTRFISGLKSKDIVKLIETLENVNISYDQLYYYERTGLIVPSVRKSKGRGVPRLYSVEDLIFLRWLVQLQKSGLPLNKFRDILNFIRNKIPEISEKPENWILIAENKKIQFVDKVTSKSFDLNESGAQFLLVFPLSELVSESKHSVNELVNK